MMRKNIILFILSLSVLLIQCCSWILTDEIEISGRVKLSDEPNSGHGGVRVSTDNIATVTNIKGEFNLKGKVMRVNDEIEVRFEKDGYMIKTVTAGVKSKSKSKNEMEIEDIDLGTIILTKEGEEDVVDDIIDDTANDEDLDGDMIEGEENIVEDIIDNSGDDDESTIG